MSATLDLPGVREGYADLGAVRLHYVEAGKGPLVVLLHGFPEFWFSWRHQIPALAATTCPHVRGGLAARRGRPVRTTGSVLRDHGVIVRALSGWR